MKKAVWKMLPVESFDMRGLEEWLSAMAARGLHLAKIGESFARFQPGPPQAGARYALDITGPTDIERDRNEAYAQAGWDYVTTLRGLYYVYRTLDPDAPALHTDPVTQSFTFDRLLRRRLWALVLLIPLILFMFRNELAALIDNPWSPVLTFLLKTEGCCLYLVLLIFYIAALIPLFRQRRALKALRKQLADGIPLEDSRRGPERFLAPLARSAPVPPGPGANPLEPVRRRPAGGREPSGVRHHARPLPRPLPGHVPPASAVRPGGGAGQMAAI